MDGKENKVLARSKAGLFAVSLVVVPKGVEVDEIPLLKHLEAPNGNPKRSGLGWDSPDQPLGAPSVPPALVERRPPPPSQEGGKPSPGEGTAGSHAGVRFIVECDSRIKPNRGGGYPPPPVLGCSCTPPV